MSTELNEQELVRRAKLEDIKKLGIDPYPAPLFEVNASAKNILTAFSLEKAEVDLEEENEDSDKED